MRAGEVGAVSSWSVRVLMVVAAAFFLVAALAIRAAFDGPLEQHSGTALYASMVYVGMVFVRPSVSPWVAGGIATAFCWIVEVSQLTGVPAALSQHSLLARLALGVQFDIIDIAWYPVGIIPLVLGHLLLHARARQAPRRNVRRPEER